MARQAQPGPYCVWRKSVWVWLCTTVLFWSCTTTAQVPPDNHQAHHPEQAAATPADTPATAQAATASGNTPATAPGMMEAMQEMMREMLAPPQKQLFPSLMELPQLPPDKRAELQAAAQERMQTGMALLSEGMDQLSQAAARSDYASMQEAIALMREATARFNSGVATQQALAEDLPPRDIALQWFRQEMKLPPDPTTTPTEGILGMSWFHFGVMLILASFAAAMLWISARRMQRASLLLQTLTGARIKGSATPVARLDTGLESPVTGVAPAAAPVFPRKWTGQLRVGRILQETPDVKTFRLMNPLGGVLPFTYLPGQFITVAVNVDGKPIKRSYTIASSPTQQDYLEITIKHSPDGLVSGHLHATIREGDLLELSGPAGAFVFTGRECKCILLIAGGVGITPMMSVLRYLLDRSWSGEIFLIYGCRSPEDIIFRKELEYMQHRYQNLRLVITVSHGGDKEWTGPTGHITKQLIAESVPDLASRYVHICGPVPMMEATKQILAELGVPAARVKTEAFGPAIGKVERVTPQTGVSYERVKTSVAEQVTAPTVTFADSGKSAPLPSGKVVLDVAEELGIDIDYSCRAGTCGACRVKLLSGEVTMAVEDGLQPGDKENHIILACQAVATDDITVKA